MRLSLPCLRVQPTLRPQHTAAGHLRSGPAERDPLSNQEPSLGVPAGSAETEVLDAAVPVESIKRQLVLEEISRSGEMGGTTYRCVWFLY